MGDTTPEQINDTLRSRFKETPLSILNAKSGYWKANKQKWLQMGIKSELGRTVSGGSSFQGRLNNNYSEEIEEQKTVLQKMAKVSSVASVFDPFLTEIMYEWFCPKGGTILDPFAGGSVRGIVANEICQENVPLWIAGDSNKEIEKLDEQFDFVFSCPPYADLEVYSDHEDDISNKSYEDFLILYRSIISKTVDKLKKGQFAVFVVGDVRDREGYYLNFVGDTKKAFIDSGAKLYNEIILSQPIGSACLYAENMFKNKKIAKIHQNILCFKKVGDMPQELKHRTQIKEIERNVCPTGQGDTRNDCENCPCRNEWRLDKATGNCARI